MSECRRHRINATCVPRLAFEDALDRKPRTAPRAVNFNRLYCVLRAGRVETALRAEERAQCDLICADRQQ